MSGLIIDLFAGGGGASTGIEMALGRSPDIAINHSPVAVAMHAANHPGTLHFCQDVWNVQPTHATKGQPVDLLWGSPDCTHFSKAKGAAPTRDAKIRDLAWVLVKWAREVSPRVIIMENVEEFQTWGPLDARGKIIDIHRGSTFKAFIRSLKRLGYKVEWRELRASDYGAPTIRKRLFLVARRDGLPIVWPEPTHGPGRAEPYRTAAEIIDWSLPCPSIFDRKRPLAENTLRRIAEGIRRFVLEAAEPFIIGIDNAGARSAVWRSEKPLSTVITKAKHAVVTPYFVPRYGERQGQAPRCRSVEEPLPTVVTTDNGAQLVVPFLEAHYGTRGGRDLRVHEAGEPVRTVSTENRFGLVSAFLAKHYTGVVGQPLDAPAGTVTTVDHHGLVAAHVTRMFGTSIGSPADAPLGTTTAGGGGKSGLVAAFLTKYYGTAIGHSLADPAATVTSKDRMGLVTVTIGGEPYVIADIGMRMLQPRELFRAQGFPDSYIIDFPFNGKPLPKSAQVRCCGNSVCPDLAAALVRANCADLAEIEPRTWGLEVGR
ncbi:MAG: hypothetical protein FD177_259 [Desulfovibrionaceae bacterium]|nr:MAG: hypothetical protein FD177_259 [Desulfovibrionaceae bacterium]